MTKTIQFVYPQDTKAVSLSGGGCGLNCSHCNKHYIEQMDTLKDPIPEGTKSLMISGGLQKDGKSFVLDKKEELLRIKKEGNYNFNSHVGFVDADEVDELARVVDFVSFDFVSDPAVIKRVYKLDKTVEEYIELFKRLSQKVKTYPHVTIGLDAGRIHWEYNAIDILHELGADRLVLNVLIPTPGTEFANVPNPNLEEVRRVFQHARRVFKDKLLIVGCMRPWGNYRSDLDVMAIDEGVDRIVQPTITARRFAEKKGFDISYLYECCALDTKTYAQEPKFRGKGAPPLQAPSGGCGTGSSGCGCASKEPVKTEAGCCGSHNKEREETGTCCKTAKPPSKVESKMRVSTGSASILGLKDVRVQAKNKTIYLMNSGGCEYSCGFCAQGKNSSSQEDKLSRVTWPEFETNDVMQALGNRETDYKRVCMQVVNTKDIFTKLPDTVKAIRAAAPNTKIAMTIRTYNLKDVDALFDVGVNEVGLSIDAIDPAQFAKIKGGSFQFHKDFVLKAADKYPGKIATHLIVGLGETEKQVVELMKELQAHQVIIALFAFTPVKGARMVFSQPPDIGSYRRIQVALHLIRNNLKRDIQYNANGQIIDFGPAKKDLANLLQNSNVFETSGCSDCNRPYYNERAGSKELYNHPDQLKIDQFNRALETIYT